MLWQQTIKTYEGDYCVVLEEQRGLLHSFSPWHWYVSKAYRCVWAAELGETTDLGNNILGMNSKPSF